MERKKVTYLINTLDYGGAEKGMIRLLSGLPSSEFNVTALLLKESDSDIKKDIPEWVTVKELNMMSRPTPSQLVSLYREIAQADIVVGSLFPSIVVGSVIGTISRQPDIYTWKHNQGKRDGIVSLLNSLSFWLSDGVFVDSDPTKEALAEHGVPERKISVLPLSGVNVEQYPAVEHKPTDTIRIGTIGRVVDAKGYPELLECADILEDFEFHVIGTGPLADELDWSRPNVVYHGFVDDDVLLRLLGTFDIYFQPSRAEGLCITAIEGMAAGLPVVASDVGGLTRSVVDGVTGYHVEQGNIDGYCSYLKQLANDYELRKQLGESGRNRVKERYSNDALVKQFRRVIK